MEPRIHPRITEVFFWDLPILPVRFQLCEGCRGKGFTLRPSLLSSSAPRTLSWRSAAAAPLGASPPFCTLNTNHSSCSRDPLVEPPMMEEVQVYSGPTQPYLRGIRAERRPCLLIVRPEQNLAPGQARLRGGGARVRLHQLRVPISSPPLMKPFLGPHSRPDPFQTGSGIFFIPVLGFTSVIRIVISSDSIVVTQSPALEPVPLVKMTVRITHCPGGTKQRGGDISSRITTVSFEGLQRAVMLPALLNKPGSGGGERATFRFVIHRV